MIKMIKMMEVQIKPLFIKVSSPPKKKQKKNKKKNTLNPKRRREIGLHKTIF